jgi:hypothetical protein
MCLLSAIVSFLHTYFIVANCWWIMVVILPFLDPCMSMSYYSQKKTWHAYELLHPHVKYMLEGKMCEVRQFLAALKILFSVQIVVCWKIFCVCASTS